MPRRRQTKDVITDLADFTEGDIVRSVEQRIHDRLPDLVEALLDLALGVRVLHQKIVDGEPVVTVYESPPDFKAAQYLTERILGKTPQRHEITGKGGGAIQIVPVMLREQALEEGLIIEGETRVLLPAAPGEESLDG